MEGFTKLNRRSITEDAQFGKHWRKFVIGLGNSKSSRYDMRCALGGVQVRIQGNIISISSSGKNEAIVE
jgi:hypothetical protein